MYAKFARAGLADDVVFIGAGRLGVPDAAVFAFALGCDMINVGREAMLAIGCIQALKCHTGECPTGVATQNRWLVRGLDPDVKHARAANYIRALRGEVLALARASGVAHPALLSPDQLEIVSGQFDSETVDHVFGYDPTWRRTEGARRDEIENLIGIGVPRTKPGAEAGPILGDEAGRGDAREHETAEPEAAAGMAQAGD
jgi:hypothetical protein